MKILSQNKIYIFVSFKAKHDACLKDLPVVEEREMKEIFWKESYESLASSLTLGLGKSTTITIQQMTSCLSLASVRNSWWASARHLLWCSSLQGNSGIATLQGSTFSLPIVSGIALVQNSGLPTRVPTLDASQYKWPTIEKDYFCSSLS